MTFDQEFTSLPTFSQTIGTPTPGWLPCPYWNERASADAKQYCCFPGIDTGYMPFSIGSGEGLSVLNITADVTPAGMSALGRSWVSGQLTTAKGAAYSTDLQSSTPFGQEYGYFEARCKLPTAAGTTKGMWPAFWLMPADGTSITEYDIFEVLGNAPTEIHQSSHWNTYANGSGSDYVGPDTSSAFHTYGFQWDATSVRWYVDGVLTQVAPNYINKAMYPLLTLSVGGSWPGTPDATTVFPATMQVEYLRVYSGGTVPAGGAIADGTYNLTCQSSEMALDNGGSTTSGTNVIQTPVNGNINQRWTVTYLNNSYYKVINSQSGMALDNGGSTTSGAVMHQATYTGSDAQMWLINNLGNGYYDLISKTSSMALHNSGSKLSGASMIQYPIQTTANEHWTFETVGSDIIMDDADTGGDITLTGSWASGTTTSGYYSSDYIHDGNTGQGTKNVKFTPTVLTSGSYNVYARWTAAANRATNVTMNVYADGANNPVVVNEQLNNGTWVLLGTYNFNVGTSGYVQVTNTGANGYVVADAVKLKYAGPPALPTPWAHQDVGSVGIAGNATYSSGAFIVTGSGLDTDNSSSDAFQYLYQSCSGDCSITARVASESNTFSAAKYGVMIRESLNNNATNAFMTMYPGGLKFKYRATTGGTPVGVGGSTGSTPYWIRVTRVGNVFTGYDSTDGVTWTNVGSVTLSMATNAYVGLMECSTSNTVTGSANFDNVTVVP